MVCHHFQPRLIHPHYKLGVHIGLAPFYVLICPSLWPPQEHLGSSWCLRHSLMALLLIVVLLWRKIGKGSSFGGLYFMRFTSFYKEPQIKNFWHHNDEDNKQTNVLCCCCQKVVFILLMVHIIVDMSSIWNGIKCVMLVTQLNCSYFNVKMG